MATKGSSSRPHKIGPSPEIEKGILNKLDQIEAKQSGESATKPLLAKPVVDPRKTRCLSDSGYHHWSIVNSSVSAPVGGDASLLIFCSGCGNVLRVSP